MDAQHFASINAHPRKSEYINRVTFLLESTGDDDAAHSFPPLLLDRYVVSTWLIGQLRHTVSCTPPVVFFASTLTIYISLFRFSQLEMDFSIFDFFNSDICADFSYPIKVRVY